MAVGSKKRKPPRRWGKYRLGSTTVPAQRAQRPEGPQGGRPSLSVPGPLQGRARPPRLPPRPPPHPYPWPGPALRDVLVEVGEEQLAGAGLAALTRQVHGGRAAGGRARPEARAREEGRVRSGSAPVPARRLGCRSSLPGDQPPPHPVSALVYAPEPGTSARLRIPPLQRTAPYGAGVLRRSRPFTYGPGESSGRTRARVGTREVRAGQYLRARGAPRMRMGGVSALGSLARSEV